MVYIEGFKGKLCKVCFYVVSEGFVNEVQYGKDEERHAEKKLVLFRSLKNYIKRQHRANP